MIERLENTNESSYRLITRSLAGDLVDLWGLHRTLERKIIESDFTSFQCFSTGKNVDIYILDSGLNKNHTEFLATDPSEQRAHILYDHFGGEGEDNIGHGTFMSSILAGRIVGTASEAQIHMLKVFDQDMSVNADAIISGLEKVIEHHKSKPNKNRSVLNLSFCTNKSGRIDHKIQEAIQAGIVVVTAAGNNGQSANNYSPAHMDSVITVGSIGQNDSFAFENTKCNFGSAVDILAPGVDIEGASAKAERDYAKSSGSSISAAYVSGVCACLLERVPNLDPFQVKEALLQTATTDLVNFDELKVDNHQTPNKIVFNEMQKLNPRWIETNTTLVGIFFWGQEAEGLVECVSRTNNSIRYEIIDGQLPSGLSLSENGQITGKLEPFQTGQGDITQYFTFLVRATDLNGSTERLFYCVATEPAEIQKEDFSDAYLVELAKAGCSGSGCCSA